MATKTNVVSVRIPDALLYSVQKIADRERRTKANVILLAIEKYVLLKQGKKS
jgi:predicted transcriptional regulator